MCAVRGEGCCLGFRWSVFLIGVWFWFVCMLSSRVVVWNDFFFFFFFFFL